MTLNDRIQLRNELIKEFEELSVICKFKGNYKITKFSNLQQALNNKSELQSKYNIYVSEFRSEDEALYCLCHSDDFTNHICPVCHTNICHFHVYKSKFSTEYKYRNTCKNTKCLGSLTNSPSANQKRINTNRNKYNVDYPAQSLDIQAKMEESCLNNFGYKHPLQHPDILAAMEATKELLYGDPHYNNREKARNTNRNRYGVDWYVETEEFKQQSKKSKQDRYNDPNYNNIEKMIQNIKNRFGVDWYFQTEEFRQKSLESNMRIRNVPNSMMDPNVVELWRRNYFENHKVKDPILLQEIQPFLDQIKKGLTLAEVYSNREYFKEFIKLSFNNKNRLLQFRELAKLFNVKIKQ